MTKKSRQKFKSLEKEKSFKNEIKNIFRFFFEVLLSKQIKQLFLKKGGSPLLRKFNRHDIKRDFILELCHYFASNTLLLWRI